jgi:hypothetical protein
MLLIVSEGLSSPRQENIGGQKAKQDKTIWKLADSDIRAGKAITIYLCMVARLHAQAEIASPPFRTRNRCIIPGDIAGENLAATDGFSIIDLYTFFVYN